MAGAGEQGGLSDPVFLINFSGADAERFGEGDDGFVVPTADLQESIDSEGVQLLFGEGADAVDDLQVVVLFGACRAAFVVGCCGIMLSLCGGAARLQEFELEIFHFDAGGFELLAEALAFFIELEGLLFKAEQALAQGIKFAAELFPAFNFGLEALHFRFHFGVATAQLPGSFFEALYFFLIQAGVVFGALGIDLELSLLVLPLFLSIFQAQYLIAEVFQLKVGFFGISLAVLVLSFELGVKARYGVAFLFHPFEGLRQFFFGKCSTQQPSDDEISSLLSSS